MVRPPRITLMRAAGVVLVVFGAVTACGADSGDGATGSTSVWQKTTVPFDPECKGCEEIGTMPVAHAGEATLLRASHVDDPEAQWTRCVNSVLDCIEQLKDESECVAGSKCPGACKNDYAKHLSALGRSDIEAKWSSIKAVFVSPTSRCALPVGARPEVTP